MIKMNLSTNKSEKVSYNFIDFPIRANKSLLSEYSFHLIYTIVIYFKPIIIFLQVNL